jgi:hypothetical protein
LASAILEHDPESPRRHLRVTNELRHLRGISRSTTGLSACQSRRVAVAST